MHIHKPRPVTKLPEFVAELAVIVVGILIALALEQAVEAFRRADEASHLDKDLRAELSGQLLVDAGERAALDRCLLGRVADLRTKLAAAGDTWKADVLPEASGEPPRPLAALVSVQSPRRTWVRSAWQSAQASDAYRALPLDRRMAYADLYKLFAGIEETAASAYATEGDLGALAYDLQLTPAMRAQYLDRLTRLTNDYSLVGIGAHQAIRRAQAMGIVADHSELARRVAAQRRHWGGCVEDVAAGPNG